MNATATNLQSHVCTETSCEIEGHDRTCVVSFCTREIEDDASDTCDQHRGEGDDRWR